MKYLCRFLAASPKVSVVSNTIDTTSTFTHPAATVELKRPAMVNNRSQIDATSKYTHTTAAMTTPSVEQCKRPRSSTPATAVRDVLIYMLVFVPTGKIMYVGKTCDVSRRFNEHMRGRSGCRLVRSAVRRHGRRSFAVEPILRCSAADADANESYYIQRHGTLYPGGLNLRHGATAGLSDDIEAPVNALIVTGACSELEAVAEATSDLADICGAEDVVEVAMDAMSSALALLKERTEQVPADEACSLVQSIEMQTSLGRRLQHAMMLTFHPDRGNTLFEVNEVRAALESLKPHMEVPAEDIDLVEM
jgi:hypothetical protein|eukprot:7384786-Prymnesium_polylepis.5